VKIVLLAKVDMKTISDKEYDLCQRMLKILKHSKAEDLAGVYFICGEAGDKDQNGLPDTIHVCPAYGADVSTTVAYKKVVK